MNLIQKETLYKIFKIDPLSSKLIMRIINCANRNPSLFLENVIAFICSIGNIAFTYRGIIAQRNTEHLAPLLARSNDAARMVARCPCIQQHPVRITA